MPRVVGALSWYDETPEMLILAIASAAQFVDHVVALDGAYALYPDAKPASDLTQAQAVAVAADQSGIGLTLERRFGLWEGNEVEKRSHLFKLALTVAEPGDWIYVIDADEVFSQARDLRAELAEVDELAVEVAYGEQRSTGRDLQKIRKLFRALPGLRCETNHFTYVTDDGTTLWDNHGHQVPAADWSDRIYVEHVNPHRDAERAQAALSYYKTRDAEGVEAGQCQECESALATARIPGSFTKHPNGVEGTYVEVCDDCRPIVKARADAQVRALGYDPANLAVEVNHAQGLAFYEPRQQATTARPQPDRKKAKRKAQKRGRKAARKGR